MGLVLPGIQESRKEAGFLGQEQAVLVLVFATRLVSDLHLRRRGTDIVCLVRLRGKENVRHPLPSCAR
jgi:hypothetical protein